MLRPTRCTANINKMSGSMIFAIVVFLASVVLSQKIAVNAAARLDDATKLKIAEIFPKRNVNYTIAIFTIVIVFLVATYMFPDRYISIMIGYAVAFLIYIFTKLILNVRKLKEIGAPTGYIRMVIVSFCVFIGGAVAASIVLASVSLISRS